MSTLEARKLISDKLAIPSLPHVVARIGALADDPEVGTREIAQVIAEDAPTAAKLLKIANSAYYGLRERVLSTEHASAVLGVRVLRNIALQASVISRYDHLRGHPDFDVDQLWRHSILTGQVSSLLAERCTGRIGLDPQEFYVVGLLHDLGKVVMLDGLGERYLEAARASRSNCRPPFQCEQELLGFNHADVGALIAMRWSLPNAVSSAIQFHHGPREALEDDPVVALVASANLLVQQVAEHNLIAAADVFEAPILNLLGLTHADVALTCDDASELASRVQV
jgi:putative nucleotidyltransferase with HDIG domain